MRRSRSMPVAVQDLLGAGTADAVDVGQRDLHALVAREIDAHETCHQAVFLLYAEVWSQSVPAVRGPASVPDVDGLRVPHADERPIRSVVLGGRHSVVVCSDLRLRMLALPLLVARIGADHHDPPVPTDHPALVADRLDARVHLHGCSILFFLGAGLAVTCTGKRCGPGTGRMETTPRPRGPRAGCGCSAAASCR